MSGERLSAATRSLLKSARADAPSAAARAKVWSGVSASVGGAAGGAAAGAGAAGLGASGAGMSAAKMLVAGTLLGGAVTVGLAAMLLHVGPSPSRTPPAAAAPVAVVAPEPPAPPAPTPALDAIAGASVNGAASGSVGAVAHPTAAAAMSLQQQPPHKGTRHVTGDDALTREASLVTGARAALAAGNAGEALRLVRTARAMPSPQLVPEELTVEAQALRSLGKADEARGVDVTLRSQYPDSALAR
jgi:hypothetical protein